MHSAPTPHHDHGQVHATPLGDPCLQIQVDLSAMLDGELDPAGVRRVMVHSDCCPSCRTFLEGIREQFRLHRELAAAGLAGGEGPENAASAALRRQLTVNQRKLSRILYELGRNFALMGLSPDFSREVAREPVPVPDMALRGRNLLDEVARSEGEKGPEWVAAKELFDGRMSSPEENLAKGQRLLSECLALDPVCDEACIYLGLVHYARGQLSLARSQFQLVLERAGDPVTRGYALSGLSNVWLDEGDHAAAIRCLLELVESGASQQQPRLLAAMFNLALAYGLQCDFPASRHWFERMYQQCPHRRRWVARELTRRSAFLQLLHQHPDAGDLATALATWFPLEGTISRVIPGPGSPDFRPAQSASPPFPT